MSSAEILNAQGAEFHLRGDLAAAAVHYNAALRLRPDYIPTLLNLTDILSRQNKLIAAAVLVSRATQITPNNGMVWSNYGNILTRLERYGPARIAHERAALLAPDSVGTWHNLLLLALRERRFDEALVCYQKIVDLGGDSPLVQNDLAHIYLTIGDFECGFEAYEARWHNLRHLEPWDLHVPEWQGEDLTGKRILVHAEQGYGDTIMTLRFLKNFFLQDTAVTFGSLPGMEKLVEAQDWPIDVIRLDQIDESIADRFDFHSPLYSAMRWLDVKKEDISSKPYLHAPELVVPHVFSDMLNVGICWSSGMRGDEMDWRRRRSPLDPWLVLGEVPGVQLWSLCPGPEAQGDILRLGAESVVIDHVSNFTDFSETAAFIDQLDLVVSVDTAVVHLAAALGKSTWMLSQYTPCWRWWGLEAGTGEPWYDNMAIQVQPSPEDWKSGLDFFAGKLATLVENRMERKAA